MANISETGHAVNISNFKLLIDKCTGFGANYNPSNSDITVPSMTAAWTTADGAHQTFITALQVAKNPINERNILFKPSSKLVTSVVNILNSTKASKQLKQDAKGLGDRFRGFGVKVKKLTDGSPDPSSVSTSHQSFVQKANTFKQLVVLLGSEINYVPNEPYLSIASLNTLATAMKTANDNIGTIIAPVDTARLTRNDLLYNEEDGIITRAAAAKDYVQGAAGFSSAVTKLIVKIKFRRM